jgi:hypothetical protein
MGEFGETRYISFLTLLSFGSVGNTCSFTNAKYLFLSFSAFGILLRSPSR